MDSDTEPESDYESHSNVQGALEVEEYQYTSDVSLLSDVQGAIKALMDPSIPSCGAQVCPLYALDYARLTED